MTALLSQGVCDRAFLCADGTFSIGGRCDFKLDCPDGGDERGCGHLMCGDKLIDPFSACDAASCPATTFTPPLCAPDNPTQFLCGDGTSTSILNVCNGASNCANGRDEQYCF